MNNLLSGLFFAIGLFIVIEVLAAIQVNRFTVNLKKKNEKMYNELLVMTENYYKQGNIKLENMKTHLEYIKMTKLYADTLISLN